MVGLNPGSASSWLKNAAVSNPGITGSSHIVVHRMTLAAYRHGA